MANEMHETTVSGNAGAMPDPGAKLGFGLMRLPRRADKTVDVERTAAMADEFLAAGGKYFDTAFVYDGSEDAFRQAVAERHPRESWFLATKMAAWAGCATREDAVRQFETSLRRTGAGYFDFYLLHNLGQARTKFFDDWKLWDWALEQKERGLLRHVGFSFHSSPEELEAVLGAHPEAEFVQLQINWADWDDPVVRSRECWETARRHGKPVIVMEPVKGGLLATPPDSAAAALRAVAPDASMPSWALRVAAGLPGVYVVLSGMSDEAQMRENLGVLGPRAFRPLGEAENAALAQARVAMAAEPTIPCTSCGYCEKVCPAGIGVKGTFAALNQLQLYRNPDRARHYLQWQVVGQGRKTAEACIKCGACEKACPQRIAIRCELERAAKTFSAG